MGVLPISGTSCAHTFFISDFYGRLIYEPLTSGCVGKLHCEEAGEEKEI